VHRPDDALGRLAFENLALADAEVVGNALHGSQSGNGTIVFPLRHRHRRNPGDLPQLFLRQSMQRTDPPDAFANPHHDLYLPDSTKPQ